MRKCKKCGSEKELNLFRRNGKYILKTCKECLNAPLRTGKPRTTAFKKGHIPWIKGRKDIISPNKGKKILPHVHEAMMKGLKNHVFTDEQKENIKNGIIKRSLKRRTKGRHGWYAKDWRDRVKERDKWICQHCGLDDRLMLESHHIIPWGENEELRFDLNNGITLCRKCHSKEDRRISLLKDDSFKIGEWAKNNRFSEEHRKKLGDTKKGKSPWNKGVKKVK